MRQDIAAMTPREGEIEAFLAAGEWRRAVRHPFAADASFRRYFRLSGGPKPALLMDAPPPAEDVRPWVKIARHLAGLGLSAPAIHQADEARGLLVIEDFGDDTFAHLLEDGAAAEPLYAAAVDALATLHRAPAATRIDVPRYDAAEMIAKASLLLDWFLPAIGAAATPEARAAYRSAWEAVLPLRERVPESLALRDYFPENLMWLPAREGVRRTGLLDFQDAMMAPCVYDLVSLVEDARRDVPAALRRAMLDRYFAAFPGRDRAAFESAAAVVAAQRHARVIGVFARLWKRDGKPGYLAHIPRVWHQLERALVHPGLAPLWRWFDRNVPAPLRRAPEAA
ncbi:MAG: aminoglycoside phosphotransferase family protein [Alphaproteobacteria bacterium]